MPASAPAPGPEITMLELAVPHPRPRRPLPPRPPAAPTPALRRRFPRPALAGCSSALAGAPGERVLIESVGREITVVDSGYRADLVHYRPPNPPRSPNPPR